MRRLFELWRLIGVKPIDSRIQDVENHFETLLDNLVSEEEKHLDKYVNNYWNYTGDFFALFILCKERRKFLNLCKVSKEIAKEQKR